MYEACGESILFECNDAGTKQYYAITSYTSYCGTNYTNKYSPVQIELP